MKNVSPVMISSISPIYLLSLSVPFFRNTINKIGIINQIILKCLKSNIACFISLSVPSWYAMVLSYCGFSLKSYKTLIKLWGIKRIKLIIDVNRYFQFFLTILIIIKVFPIFFV